MRLKPTSDRILIQLIDIDEKKEQHILIPEQIKQNQGMNAEVVEIGPSVSIVKKGDKILFAKYAGEIVIKDKKQYFVISVDDVLAIWEE